VSAADASALPLRVATRDDVRALHALIDASARALSAPWYPPELVDSMLRHLIGVDTQLVDDGTYYVVVDPDGALAAAGGWSARRTLYGGDQAKGAADPRLDPAADPARIRAFFVHPRWARRGLARRLYARCAHDARRAGFRAFELVATLPGEPLYASLGFTAGERTAVPLPDGLALPCVHMTRVIDAEG
jgi:GNAT superfamily N-acetyltransferase